jgi:5'-3' exonuclease
MKGDYDEALKEWQILLNYFVNICGFKNMCVVFDGKVSQANKQHEEHRRRNAKRKFAKAKHDLSGQIRNDPLYISMATRIADSYQIGFIIAYAPASIVDHFRRL